MHCLPSQAKIDQAEAAPKQTTTEKKSMTMSCIQHTAKTDNAGAKEVEQQPGSPQKGTREGPNRDSIVIVIVARPCQGPGEGKADRTEHLTLSGSFAILLRFGRKARRLGPKRDHFTREMSQTSQTRNVVKRMSAPVQFLWRPFILSL